jgi:nitrite reductase (NADH) large subunit
MTRRLENHPVVQGGGVETKNPAARRAKAGAQQTLVVVGNGMAGHKFCERLAALGGLEKFKVIVFGEERRPAYDRVHLAGFLQGRTPEQLLLAPAAWYVENGIELHLDDPAANIDRARCIVRSASGRELNYDRLVLATGSRAFVPPLEGCDLPGVFVYRTLDDLERLKAYAANCKRAAVLGGGLLGVEAAKALKDLRLDTWVVERGVSLLTRQLDPEAGALLRAHVEKLGIHVCTQRETERIEALGADRLLQFNTGECLRVQLVVVAAGIRPRDELAAQCGLEIAQRGGIRVNDWLQTSDPNIYAIGECASHNGICYGLAAPGYKMADVLAESLLGKRRRFTGSDQSTRLKLAGIEVSTLGEFHAEGQTLRWSGTAGCRRLVLEKGRLIGATAIGEWTETGRVQELIERNARVWRWQQRRFLQTGRIWSGEAALSVTHWPEAAVVCNCVNVRRGALSAACAAGCVTVEQLAARTGASTVCGSCKPLLAELVGAPAWSLNVAGLRLLGIASALAAVFVLTLVLVNPIPFADSVQTGWHKMDALWRSGALKQTTGFTLLGLGLAGLGLSLRKRIRRFAWG